MSKNRWPVASTDADFAPYLDGRPEASVAMFGRFIELARAAGPVVFELQNGPVVLRGTRRIFASVRIVNAGLAGHVAWIIALRQRPGRGHLRARPALAAPHLITFGAVNAYLWKRTGQDRIPVIVYSTALLAMSLAALDSGSPRTAAGGALFLASDTLLALEKFGGLHLPAHEGLVMATYTSAQVLLAG